MESPITEKEPSRKEWRGFWTLMTVQAQNAMNEKAAQFILIPLGAALWKEESQLPYILGAIIVLPYLVISPLVGWLSDRFCKTRIVQLMAFMQILVLLGMWFSLLNHNIHGAIIWFTIFAIQATVLSPAKKGIVKDIVGVKYIGFASGLVEMSTVFALIIGQIGVFIVFNILETKGFGEWEAAYYPTFALMLIAIPTSLATLILPKYPVLERKPFEWNIFYKHFGQIKELWSDRRLRLSEIGISYFWFFAGVMLLITLQIAEVVSGDSAHDSYSLLGAKLMAWMSGGVVFGGVIVSLMSRRKVELGTIPIGAAGMTLSCLLLACFPMNSYPFLVSLSLAGVSGAFFLVPLNAYLQNTSEDSRRGNIIAAGNFLDMAMGLVAVGFQFMMRMVGMTIAQQCVVMAFLCLGISVIVFRLIPREFIRLIGVWTIQLFFRPRIMNGNRMPEKGGVLLISNHVTLVDAFFLTMSSHRPVRFLVAEEYITFRALGWILELFNSVPISHKNPREALKAAADAVKNGEVICIFPEGQLTRTGVMTELRRGFEVIAHAAKVPVLPVYMDGLWGGFMSYKKPKSAVKFPRRVPQRFTVAYGEPLDPQEISPEIARSHFQILSAQCLDAVAESGRSTLRHILESLDSRIMVSWSDGCLKASEILTVFMENRCPEGDSPGHVWMRQFLALLSDKEHLSRVWLNARQIQRVNALMPRECLLVCVGTHELHEDVVSIIWPLLTRTHIYLLGLEDTIPGNVCQIAGGEEMRKKLEHITALNRYIPFFDFSGLPPQASIPNVTSRPCYLSPNGEVIAMSMHREVYIVDKHNVQFGLKFGSRGLLLPGFVTSVDSTTGKTIVSGPSLKESFELSESYSLDASNFILEKSHS